MTTILKIGQLWYFGYTILDIKASQIFLLPFLISIFGCAGKPVALRVPSTIESPDCSQACTSTEVCMNTFTDAGAKCAAIPSAAPIPDLILPFDRNTEVVCTHSSGSGSHSGSNAFYAIDLASDYSKPAAIIRAAADGVAYVFVGEDGKLCPEPEGQPSSAKGSTCGDSVV